METEIEFTRINNDVNGNPRYVCHFLNFVNDKDMEQAEKLSKETRPFEFPISYLYQIAIKKANKIGGRKFHNKQFGGGIVFQSYNIYETEKHIKEVKKLINKF